MTFGKRLHAALEYRGWTQGKLAHQTGLSQGHISMIMSNQRQPTVGVATALAEALDVSLDWLCDVSREMDSKLLPDEEEIVRLYRSMPESVRPMALGTMRAMAEGARGT